MKVTKDKVENAQAFLTVEMEPAEMEASIEDSYKRLSMKANIPGFRKGKAPRAVLENYIGRESILEEAIKQMVPQAYEQALQEQEIEPFAQPEVEITQSEPVIFKAVVPLAPTVELGDYHAIEMTPETVEVTEQNIDDVMEELRHQHATWEPVERAVDFNDMAIIDIDGTVEEKPYVKKIGAQYQVLKDAIIPAPGFSDYIAGMQKGEEKEFTITFPEDYPNKEVAGKEGQFTVKLSEIKEEKLTEMNDELAVQVSPDFKTVDDLREEVSKSLIERNEERSRMDFQEKVVEAVIEQATMEYPPVLVEMEINRILNEQARQLQQSGRNIDDYLASINKTGEQFREDIRPVATKNVAASLVLGKVSAAEKIEVMDTEIDAGIDSMMGGLAEDRREDLRKMLDTPQTRESIRQSLLTRKTIERLSDIAKGSGTAGAEANTEETKSPEETGTEAKAEETEVPEETGKEAKEEKE